MKKVLLASMFLLLQLAAHAQDTKYTLTLNVPEDGTLSAYAYGTSTYDRRSEYAAGEEVHLTGSIRSEYSFVSWTDEQGKVVCDSLRYTFTMPARNVTLTGHTEYDPENPPGPREDGYTDTWNRLYLRSNPSYGGAFTWGLGAESAQNWLVWTGYEFTVQAYPATGFTFVGWQLDGEIVSTDNPYTFIMPERDMTLYAMYEYDPETPAHPSANKWDKESGELIMSDFKPGNLQDMVTEVTRRDPWNSDWALIKSVIVAGPALQEGDGWATGSDWGAFRYANNIEYMDYSRTSGLTTVTTSWAYGRTALTTLVIPATVTSIDASAFHGCPALTSVTCFATTPPSFGGLFPGDENYKEGGSYWYPTWAFDGLNFDNIIVHVPAEAVPLYQEARGWKELMILPITQGVQKLTVSLPQAGSYKDMFLELVNTKTLQSQRYVITSATSYTFNNLIKDTQHTLYLKNQRGDILGTVPNIDIKDKDVQVSFTDLKTPIDVTVKLMLPNGNYLPSLGEGSGVGITWTDRQGVYLGQGPTLPGQLSGTQLQCRIKLDETLGRQYQNPADTLFEVKADTPLITHLSPFTTLTLAGTVTAASTEKPVRNAVVTVSQMLNGAYAVTQSTKTDVDGHWAMTVYDAPTTVTVSHTDYLKQSITLTDLSSLGDEQGVDLALKDITGTIVDLDLSYTAAVADGEESVTEEGYSGYDNISYTVYDETHGQELTDISSQYPILVLIGDELPQGTRLRITATSITDDFMPITTTCTVGDDAHATAIFAIKEMGQLKASFEMTDNMSVMGVLYDGDGQQVGWAPYKDTELTATHLKDGDYTLITMGYSELFTSVSSLDNLLSLHGMDDQQMVKNEVSIRSGHITTVTNHIVPVLDEDRFRYTSDATSVSVNKSEVTVGSYVTVRAELGFKPAYVDALSKVRLQFDIPEGCEFVENSMMVGNHTASYEVDDRRITVLIEDLNDMVRFCVVPTQGGLHEISAGTRFRINGATTIQPIGAVTFSAEDLTINVPETTGRRLLPVTGMAVPLSQVEVFDGGISIGQTTSIGTGYFSVMCPLHNPYNLSEHDIYAVVTTPEGLQMQSETEIVKIDRGHLTPVVTYETKDTRGESNNHKFVFDFRTNEVNPKGIKVSALGNFYINFRIDFYDENDLLVNDTTAIKDVILHVLYERRNVETYHVKYNVRQKCWFYQPEMNYSNLPINVDVEYTNVLETPTADREQLDNLMDEMEASINEGRQAMLDIYHMFDYEPTLALQPELDELAQLLELDNPDEVAQQRQSQLVRIIVGDSIMDAAIAKYAIDFSEVDALVDDPNASVEKLQQASNLLTQLYNEWTARYDAAINEEGTSFEEDVLALAAELEKADRVTRDSLFSLATIMYLPDTTAFQRPSGDMSFIQPLGDKYRQYTIKKLSSINSQQLLAEGYGEMPLTDGTIIYFRHDGNLQCYIDSRDLMLYSLEVLDSDEAMARLAAGRVVEAEVNPVTQTLQLFPVACIDKIGKLFDDLGGLINDIKTGGPDLTFNLCKDFANLLNSGVDILACLYDSARDDLEKIIKTVFEWQKNGAEKDYQKALLKKAEAEAKIAEKQALIAANNATKAQYVSQISRLNSRLATATEAQRATILSAIAQNEGYIRNVESVNATITKNMKPFKRALEKAINKGEKALNKLGKLTENLENFLTWVGKFIPQKYNVFAKLERTSGKWMTILTSPPLEPILKAIPFGLSILSCVGDINKWLDLEKRVEAILPCEGDPVNAQQLYADCKNKRLTHVGTNGFQMVADGLSYGASLVPSVPLVSVNWWASKIIDGVSFLWSLWQPGASENDRKRIQKRLDALKCDPDPDDDDNNDNNNNQSGTLPNGSNGNDNDDGNNNLKFVYSWNFLNLWFVRDPAGYVYEAVNSNRVEGVTATCYYKETKEDMYGDFHDEAVVWDAENYAQENPLFTDAEGRYQWDVPTGLWQVKYEKQGYETTYSDWLPVPPPQLEVNVGITQMKQPNVAKVKAYEDGIDITFDKYMRPHTLTSQNIFVTKGGQTISGKIELLNAESGYQTPDSVYASQVRFVPDNANLNANDKVQLTVKRVVESYAGIPMEQDFTQQFDVEQRIEALIADSLLNMQEGSDATLYVRAVPAAAAKGKKVAVTTSDAEAVALSQQQVTLNDNGEAKVSVSALSDGSSVVRFTLTDDDELTTTTLVTVRDKSQMQVAAPKTSRLNGTTLYIGSEIRLTCATSGATIFYTLNGVCPCDYGNKSIFTYDGPIVITGDSIHIKAMAVAPGMEDSPVVEFSYKGIARPDGIEAPTVPDGSPVGTEAPKLFFRLNGQRITKPERGVTIERQGSRVRKVVTTQ